MFPTLVYIFTCALRYKACAEFFQADDAIEEILILNHINLQSLKTHVAIYILVYVYMFII